MSTRPPTDALHCAIWRHPLRAVTLGGLLCILGPSPVAAQPAIKAAQRTAPRLPADAAARFQAEEARLRRALTQLKEEPLPAAQRRRARQQAQAALAALLGLIDAAHHDPQLAEPKQREAALALRPLLFQARGHEAGLLTLYQDIWQARPWVYERLAHAAQQDRDAPAERRLWLAALYAGPPTMAQLERGAVRLRALGEEALAQHLEAQRLALRQAVPSTEAAPLEPAAP